jgi:peptide/nickel transport system substrate-binding protein
MKQISKAYSIAATAAVAVALLAAPADAQKSKNTMRIAVTEAINGIDRYLDPKIESNVTSNMVFDFLIGYDDRNAKFQSRLAKSWKRISPTILEVELQNNITWHDGEKFDADDVVYTTNWLIDKKTKLRFKGRHRWIKSIEKTGPHTVRFHAKKPFPIDLFRLAYEFTVMPEHIHAKLENKLDFRNNIVGTGPYRVASLDKSTGLVLEKFKGRPNIGAHLAPSNVDRFHFRAIPDKQTQMAELLRGNIDLTKDLSPDQVKNIVKDPRYDVTTNPSLATLYVLLDAVGRTGDTPLKDIRVRKAMAMAINRQEIADVLIGNNAKLRRAVCDPRAFGCASDNEPPAYDPAGAKKLLAEAGYPNGFKLEHHAISRLDFIGEALVGYWRKVGIEAVIKRNTFASYRKVQRAGKMASFSHTYSAGGLPDAQAMADFFWSPGPRNYHGDAQMLALRAEALGTLDANKRKAAFRKLFTRVNEMSYVIPLTNFPVVFVHSKDIAIKTGSVDQYGATLFDISWK